MFFSVHIFLNRNQCTHAIVENTSPEHHWCTAICFSVIVETQTIGTHPLIRSSPDINFMVCPKTILFSSLKIDHWFCMVQYNFLRQDPIRLSQFTGEIVIFFEMTWRLYPYWNNLLQTVLEKTPHPVVALNLAVTFLRFCLQLVVTLQISTVISNSSLFSPYIEVNFLHFVFPSSI